MSSRYPEFDRGRIRLRPLSERHSDVTIHDLLALDGETPAFDHPDLLQVANRLLAARERGAARLLMMGAHVIKSGASRFVIDLMKRGIVTHVALNGAGAIHDSELARIGATSESVARYIRSGEFGLWSESGILNDWICEAAQLGLGLGENAGRRILADGLPHADVSILAAGYQLSIPVTVHAGVGFDIIHAHPNCDGAALGAASYRDFLIFAHAVEQLQGGVMLSFGSAIMAPEVYLKALAMARNVAHPEDRVIRNFTTAVFDIVPLRGAYNEELPKTDPGYYFRPRKTILVRTVADGGESFYFCADHRASLPALRRALATAEAGSSPIATA